MNYYSRQSCSLLEHHKLFTEAGDFSLRIDVEAYRRQGIGVVTWTVNRQEEKEHFQNVLKIPFITDHVVGQSTNELW